MLNEIKLKQFIVMLNERNWNNLLSCWTMLNWNNLLSCWTMLNEIKIEINYSIEARSIKTKKRLKIFTLTMRNRTRNDVRIDDVEIRDMKFVDNLLTIVYQIE